MKTVKGYVCKTSWEWDINGDCFGTTIYPTLEDLKDNTNCWKSCGIVEVDITLSKVIRKGKGWRKD